MNHVDAFCRGLAAVLVVSMLALAVAPASAGQQEGSGKALVAPPGATTDAEGTALPSQGQGSGKALVAPSEAVDSQGEGTGQAPPALAPDGVLFGKSGGSGQTPPSVDPVGLDRVGATSAVLAPG